MTFIRIMVFLAILPGLAACGSFSRMIGSTPITRNIDDEAIALNNAHARSINGVITVNILRARDQWPTGYTTLSGVRFSPTRTFGGTLLLDPLGIRGDNPVGEGREKVARPLAGSTYSATGSLETGAQYSVNPFAEQDNSQSLYSTEQSEGLFRRYFEGGWPATVVLPLFVDSVGNGSLLCRIDGDGPLAALLNNPSDPSALAAFNAKYPESDHPCRTVYQAYSLAAKDLSSILWQYDERSDYDCIKSVCTLVDTSRRTSIRQGLSNPIGAAVSTSSKPCSKFLNGGNGLVEDMLRAATEEGLGAKLDAINSSSGRELVVTPGGLHLCDRLASGRRFYVKNSEANTDETNAEIIRRLIDAYQDHALANYLLRQTVVRDKNENVVSIEQTVASNVDLNTSNCLSELTNIKDGHGRLGRVLGCDVSDEDLRELLLKFASERTYWRPFKEINFRSFDDIIHFVGETLRLDEIDKGQSSSLAQRHRWSGLCVERVDNDLCTRTLFKVDRRGLQDNANQIFKGHGVKVQHAGYTWHVLPELDPDNVSIGPADRTGTVLTILSQIYLLNQSSEFLEAPDNVLIR